MKHEGGELDAATLAEVTQTAWPGMSLHAFWHKLFRPGMPDGPGMPPPAAGNPVLAWLDACRAAVARHSRGTGRSLRRPQLTTHIGGSWCRWTCSRRPLDGMLWPLGFQAFRHFNPAMPPERLSTHVWVADDAETNIGHAAAQLARVLGPQPIVDRYNTRRAEWRWGSTLLTLIAWPATMQSGPNLSNPAHRRDPRLVTACSMSVQTGWRPPLSMQDRACLGGFVPMGPTRNWTTAGPQDPASRVLSAEALLEFIRDPPAKIAHLRGAFGLSAGKEALIICDDALFVIPLTAVSGFEVRRTLPAKGGGGGELSAMCDTGYAACPSKTVPVAKGSGSDDLNEVAARLAAAAGKPFTLGEYDYDC